MPASRRRPSPSLAARTFAGQVCHRPSPRRKTHFRRTTAPSRPPWEIDEIGGGVSKLTVIHDLEGAPQLAVLVGGGMESEGAGGGWNEVLSDLKTLLETGEPLRG